MMTRTLVATSSILVAVGIHGTKLLAQGAANATAVRVLEPAPAPLPHPPPTVPPMVVESSLAVLTNIPLKAIAPGLIQIGKVQLDQQERCVRFPATLNLDHGPMEYFLVTPFGKTHESVLKSDAEPYHIHIAMLLLGANSKGTNSPFPEGATGAPGPIKNPSKETIPGDPISIQIAWQAGGKDIRRRAEELVFCDETHSPMQGAHWVYNGSRVWNGHFLPQMGGSIVSLITDLDSLMNNTGPGHDNDKIWAVNTNNLPPLGLPLEVTLKLEDSARR